MQAIQLISDIFFEERQAASDSLCDIAMNLGSNETLFDMKTTKEMR